MTHADGISASLAAAFTVTQGGQARLITNLVTPSSLGYHVASTLDLEYANSGDLAMPAPILTVTISQTHADGTTDQKAFLTLDSALATGGALEFDYSCRIQQHDPDPGQRRNTGGAGAGRIVHDANLLCGLAGRLRHTG